MAVSRLPPGPGYPLYLLRRMPLLSRNGLHDYINSAMCAMPVHSLTQLKLAFIPSPTCRTAQQAHGWRIPRARPEMPQYATLNPAISALTASHALALP